ncbi:alpha/beta fold hydrolase [Pelagivirga sediminicola]|nr:alpha/beta fold hydrolase [Pelagivirga sediminicola]
MTFEARHTVRTPTGRMAWRQWGTRGPLIVLLHGVGLNADIWEPQADALSGTHRVFAVDLPGHGASDPLQKGAGLEDFAGRILAAMDGFADGPVLLVGHSMGALVTIAAALAAPERIRGIAALNAVYCRTPSARAAAEARAALLEQAGVMASIEPTIERWFGPGDAARRDSHASTLRAMLADVDPVGYARAYRIFATQDRAFEGRMKDLAMPALFLTGADDPNSTPDMSRAMADAAPRGEALIVPGARHMAGFVTPGPVNAALHDFSARVLAQSGAGETT